MLLKENLHIRQGDESYGSVVSCGWTKVLIRTLLKKCNVIYDTD